MGMVFFAISRPIEHYFGIYIDSDSVLKHE